MTPNPNYIVLCLTDNHPGQKFVQVSNRGFETYADAIVYADGVHRNRLPIVVKGQPCPLEQYADRDDRRSELLEARVDRHVY